MPTRIRGLPAGAVFLLLICLAGCGQEPTVYGTGGSAGSWSSSAADRIPGIDEASVTFITLKAGPPKGLPFVVWSDLANGNGGSGNGSAGGASYEGRHSASDGRRIEFRATTTGGNSGSITIAGVNYDLAKGSLFLVSARDDPPRVAQINFDLSGFPEGDALKALAKSNPQIREFFEKHKKEDAKSK